MDRGAKPFIELCLPVTRRHDHCLLTMVCQVLAPGHLGFACLIIN